MAMNDSSWLFFVVFAVIATVSVLNVGEVTADNKNVNHGDGESNSRESADDFFSAADAARQDDYGDYFEDPDDSTVTQNDVAVSGGRALSQKLSWSPPPQPSQSADDNDDDFEPAPGQTSLVIVFDGAATMSRDLKQLQEHAKTMVQVMNGWDRIPIFNYIFVPVQSEPTAGVATTKIVTRNETDFLEAIDNFTVKSEIDDDCSKRPIYRGIESALESCLPKSFILVFTDAYDGDSTLVPNIVQLIQEKQATVFIHLTGVCGFDVASYEQITETGNSLVLHQREGGLEDSLKNLPQLMNNQNVLLRSEERETFIIEFSVDSNIKTIIVEVQNPQFVDFEIIDPFRKKVKTESILTTLNWRIVKVMNPEPGRWTLQPFFGAFKSVRVVGVSDLILDYGFSQTQLEYFNQSSHSPTLGTASILYIRPENSDSFGRLTKAHIVLPNQSDSDSLEMSLRYNSTSKLFVSNGSYELPRTQFQLSVVGIDQQGFAIHRILSQSIKASIGNPPDLIFREEPRTVVAGSFIKIVCHTRTFGVATSVILKRNQNMLKILFSENDPRIVHETAVVRSGDSGNYSCSARNEFGTREKTMQLTVTDPPPQLELRNDAVEGNNHVEIVCSLLRGETQLWTINGTKIESLLHTDSFELIGNSLILKNVHRNMSGEYSCIANSNSTLPVNVEYPVEKVTDSRNVILFDLGDHLTINCGLRGNPNPTIRWMNPETFAVNDHQEIIIKTAERRMDGMILKCAGSNRLSTSVIQNDILLKEKLSVVITQSPDPVDNGKDVVITCNVLQTANIERIWSVNGMDMEYFDSRISKSGPSITIHKVAVEDPLTVECLVKASFGSFKASKLINIQQPAPALTPKLQRSKPEIDPKSFQDFYPLDELRDFLGLLCIASGSPTPKIYWTHEDQVIQEGPRLNISLAMDDGEYSCRAENSEGKTAKWFIIERQPPQRPTIEEVVNLVEGNTLNISCPIMRHLPFPPNDILWTSNKLSYRGDNLLLIHASPSDSGSYSCCLPRGFFCAKVRVNVKSKRRQHELINRYVEVSPGKRINLQCEGSPTPNGRFEWWKGDQQVDTARTLILTGTIDSEGAYKCLSLDESNEYEVQYQVAFKQFPEINRINHDPDHNLFECVASGHPQPVIAWLHGGSKVISTTLIQYGKEMLIDSLKSGKLIVMEANGEGYATKESVNQILMQLPREKPIGLLQRINNRNILKWIVPRGSEVSGGWTCVAMNKWGTMNESLNVAELTNKLELLAGESEQTNITIIQGLPLILECQMGNQRNQIRWSRNNVTLFNNPRLSIKKNNNQLIIWETTLEDAATYKCHLEDSKGYAIKTYHVLIQEPPEYKITIESKGIPDDSSIIKISALKGHSAVLHCPITGTPEPTITWHQFNFSKADRNRQLTPLYNEGINLTIRPHESTEFYQCSGVSSLGHFQVLFEVTSESRPTIKNPNATKLNPKLFSSILLPCWTDANPSANITWYRNTKILPPSLRIRISANSQVVRISNIRSEDNGVYSCVAKNHLGTVSKTFSIQVSLPTLLSPWSKWTNCSESCGLGTRHRTRECLFWNGDTASTDNTPQCAGDKLETEECLVTECPVDGLWSEWTSWSPCSATCKSSVLESTPSVKYRHRDCSNPAPAFGGSPCKGASYQQEICEVPLCPIDGGWSLFSSWSTCSATCGVGMQVRNRICNNPVPQFNGRECQGEAFEVKHCNEGVCSQSIAPQQQQPLPTGNSRPEWSPWTEWSECTANCGSGLMSRTRKCLRGSGECAGENIEYQQCEGKRCEARFREEETHRWFFNSQSRAEKLQATASASISSSSSSSSQEEEGEEGDDDDDAPEKLSLGNFFNPQVSITLESSIPLTKDVSKIHFASQPTEKQKPYSVPKNHKSCELGFEYRNGFCEDINECLHHDPPVCSPSQVCVNTRGGFACECDSGYEMFENAQKCVDIDECARHIHDCSHTCVNTPGAFYCDCPGGLVLTEDFRTCTEDVSKMELRDAPEEQVFYVDRDHCPDGYASVNDKCEDVDECKSLLENCTTDQRCLNTNGGYVCLPAACPENFIEKDDGRTCLELCRNATDITIKSSSSSCANGAQVANTITHTVIVLDNYEESSEMPIHKLVGYDNNGRALPHTHFHLQFDPTNNHLFHLKQWKQGMAFVFANELLEDRIYKLVVYGRTVDGRVGGDEQQRQQLLYLHKFIIYLYRRRAEKIL